MSIVWSLSSLHSSLRTDFYASFSTSTDVLFSVDFLSLSHPAPLLRTASGTVAYNHTDALDHSLLRLVNWVWRELLVSAQKEDNERARAERTGYVSTKSRTQLTKDKIVEALDALELRGDVLGLLPKGLGRYEGTGGE